nr:MAG TPA: hypothetical protein [Caudoviricetes sp.]
MCSTKGYSVFFPRAGACTGPVFLYTRQPLRMEWLFFLYILCPKSGRRVGFLFFADAS